MTIQGHMTTYRYFLRVDPFMHWFALSVREFEDNA